MNAQPDVCGLDDPFQWLEEIHGDKSLKWVEAQNTRTRSILANKSSFEPLRNQILQILNAHDNIAFVQKMGDCLYNFWQDAEHERGLWRRTTMDSYQTAHPIWKLVLDVDELAATEKSNWVWVGAEGLYPHYERCLISLSRGGSDAVEVREFDLQTKTFVVDGFYLPEANTSVNWRDSDSVFVATDFGPGSLTDSGYPRLVKLWRRGTPLEQAEVLLEGHQSTGSIGAWISRSRGYHRELIGRGFGFYTEEVYLRHDGELTRIPIPEDANLEFLGSHILITLRSDWVIGDKFWPSGSLIAADFEAFQSGQKEFTSLFTPRDLETLGSMVATRDYLIVHSMHNLHNQLVEWQWKDGVWVKRQIQVPEFGEISLDALDPDNSNDYFLYHTDFVTPYSVCLVQAGSDRIRVLKQAPTRFNALDLEVTQNAAVSKDGTRIPYFVVKPKNVKFDATAPTLLYGYGGFELSLMPRYDPIIGKAWLEKGGVYVLATIRGGSEFGPDWHRAALKENRQKSYDDFIAVATDLINKKITQPQKLGIMGASNGGLLMGVMLTQRPDLFGAVVCQVPLLDMKRYNKLLAGPLWESEYGNPDNPDEWSYIRPYSPYHNLKSNTQYPPILFRTSTNDDRVHPGHARKMMAKMLSMNIDSALYYENTEGGHTGAENNKQLADLTALEFAFLWSSIH